MKKVKKGETEKTGRRKKKMLWDSTRENWVQKIGFWQF